MTINYFKNKIKPIPVAFSGLGLATVSISILYKNFTLSPIIAIVALIISAILFSLVLIRNLLHFYNFRLELRDPVLGAFYSTFTMGIMLWATVFKPYAANFSFIVWLCGFIGHAVLLLLFIFHRLWQKDFHKALPSWAIPIIGFNVSVVAGVEFIQVDLLTYILYAEYILASILITLVLYYLFFEHALKENLMPTFGVLGAPSNLMLIGVISVHGDASGGIITTFLMVLGIFSSIIVYVSLIKLVKLKFSPLFTAYTFPVVLAATATFRYSKYLQNNQLSGVNFYHNVAMVQSVIATVLFSIIFIKLIMFVTQKIKQQEI